MTKTFPSAFIVWDGKGEMPDDAVHFVTRDGHIKGRPYVRARAVAQLRRWRTIFTAQQIDQTLAATVDHDGWLRGYNGCMPSAVARAVEETLWQFSPRAATTEGK